MLMNTEITRLAEAAGRAARAERVVVFGSRARGDAGATSDLDLALIVPDSADRRSALRAALVATSWRKLPVDLVVLAHTNWAKGTTLLARTVRREGRTVYGG